MVTALILVGAIAVIYYMSQQDTADAPGHCEASTVQCGQKLSFEQLVQLATNAGFGADSQTAAAIAMAESSGDPNAYNPETQAEAPQGQGSIGLWQIYQYKHPEFSCTDLTDPAMNAWAAYTVYQKSGGFNPWSTFKNGKYQDFLNA